MRESEDLMKQLSKIPLATSLNTSPTEGEKTIAAGTGVSVGSDGSGQNALAPINLQSMTPDEINSAMDHLLPPCVATSFEPKHYWGDDPGWIGAVIDYEFTPGAEDDEVSRSIEMLDQWMRPADHNEIIKELGKLRALVTTRKEDHDSLAIILGAFAEQIEDARYPIDVVRQARIDSAQVSKFWPSWAEFKEHCDGHFLKRKAYYMALRRYLASKS